MHISINLVDSVGLIKVYKFINLSYGHSVVFPETRAGVLLITFPSTSAGDTPELNLTTINRFGQVKSISLDASKNIVINQKYEVLYKEDGKDLKLKLNDQGKFVQ